MSGLTRPESKRFTQILLLTCFVGLFLRVITALLPVMGVEESLHWTFASHPRLMLEGTQPPLFLLLLAGWMRILGEGLLGIRLLSCLAGGATVYMSGLLGRQIAGNSFGILFALLVATNPLAVHIGAIAGPYALLFFLMMTSVYLLIVLCDSGSENPLHVGFFSLTLVLGVFTHYYFLALIPLMILYLFLFRKFSWNDSRIARPFYLSFGIAIGGILLYSPIAWTQISRYLAQTKLNGTALRFPGAKIIGWFEQTSPAAPMDIPGWLGPAAAWLCFLLFGYGAFVSIRKRRAMDPMPHLLFSFAFLLLVAVSLLAPLINEHFIWFLLPGYLMFVALGGMGLKKIRWVVIGLLALSGTLSVIWSSLLAPYPWKSPPDWKEMSKRILAQAEPGDVLLVEPPWMSMALRYHLDRTEPKRGQKPGPWPVLASNDLSTEPNSAIHRIFFICVLGNNCSRPRQALEANGYKNLDSIFLNDFQFEVHQKPDLQSIEPE